MPSLTDYTPFSVIFGIILFVFIKILVVILRFTASRRCRCLTKVFLNPHLGTTKLGEKVSFEYWTLWDQNLLLTSKIFSYNKILIFTWHHFVIDINILCLCKFSEKRLKKMRTEKFFIIQIFCGFYICINFFEPILVYSLCQVPGRSVRRSLRVKLYFMVLVVFVQLYVQLLIYIIRRYIYINRQKYNFCPT